MKNIVTLLLFVGFLFSCSLQNGITYKKLQNGDLIFVEAKQENLSGAINRVTQKSKTENFDHVGIIETTSSGIFVLHASTKLGSNKQSLEGFYTENLKNHQNMVVYRLQKDYQNSIESAIIKVNSMLGKPYNWSYVLNEESYYCSDFIERAFRKDAVFEHIPMNFKNPETHKIDEYWIQFYQKLELEVPQGQPGTNPNQLASSDKLRKVGKMINNNK